MPRPALCREVPEIACRAPEPSSKDRHNSPTARERNSAGDRLAPHCGSRAGATTGACSSPRAGLSSDRGWRLFAAVNSPAARFPGISLCGARLLVGGWLASGVSDPAQVLVFELAEADAVLGVGG